MSATNGTSTQIESTTCEGNVHGLGALEAQFACAAAAVRVLAANGWQWHDKKWHPPGDLSLPFDIVVGGEAFPCGSPLSALVAHACELEDARRAAMAWGASRGFPL